MIMSLEKILTSKNKMLITGLITLFFLFSSQKSRNNIINPELKTKKTELEIYSDKTGNEFCLLLYGGENKDIQPEISVYFSPSGGCTSAIIEEISNAKKEILVQAYSFTSKEISNALIMAQKRKLSVEVIQDKRQYESEKKRKSRAWQIFLS